jgi:hypothetical protein
MAESAHPPISYRAVVSTAALAVALAVTAPPAAADSAMAWSAATGALSIEAEAGTPKQARSWALESCAENGAKDCKILVTCNAGGGHLAVALNKTSKPSHAALVCGRTTREAARDHALAQCRKHSGKGCEIVGTLYENPDKVSGERQKLGLADATPAADADHPPLRRNGKPGSKGYWWIKTYKEVPPAAHLLASRRAVCSKNGDPGTVLHGSERCTYVNIREAIPKWTHSFHVLAIGRGARAVWKPVHTLTRDDRLFLAATQAESTICRASTQGGWFVGRLLDSKFTCELTARQQKLQFGRDSVEVLVVYPSDTTAPHRGNATKPEAAAKPTLRQNTGKRGDPAIWRPAQNTVPTGSYLMKRTGPQGAPNYICRVRHPQWGWYNGTLFRARTPKCAVAGMPPMTGSIDEYEVMGFRQGYTARWRRFDGQKPRRLVSSTDSHARGFGVCRILVAGEYVIGQIDGLVCAALIDGEKRNRKNFEYLSWVRK